MPKIEISQKVAGSLSKDQQEVLKCDEKLTVFWQKENTPADFEIILDQGALKIRAVDQDWVPLWIDFNDANWQRRLKDPLRWRDPLAKAVGIKANSKNLRVLDLTAGLGSDAWFLSQLGARVTALENSAVLYLLLCDGLQRARGNSFQINFAESEQFLKNLAAPSEFDVLYLDPMFDPAAKKGLPPREMQYLRALLGEDAESRDRLIQAAMAFKVPRTVLKLPLRAPEIQGCNLSMKGKSHRFDVFLKP